MDIKQCSHILQANCRVALDSVGTQDPSGVVSYAPVGMPRTVVDVSTDTDTTYCVRLRAGVGATGVLNVATGLGTSGPYAAGTRQELTMSSVGAGTVTAGNLEVTVVSARYPWVNQTYVVPVTNGLSFVAALSTALNVGGDFGFFHCFGYVGYLVFDRFVAANDPSLSIIVSDGTPSTGFPGSTSSITQAGVAAESVAEACEIYGIGTPSANGTLGVTVSHPLYNVVEVVSVPVLAGDTTPTWLDKVIVALEANDILASCATFTRSGNFIRMVDLFKNDNVVGDMTMAFDNAVSGITAATSAQIVEGSGGAEWTDADSKDVNGTSIPALGYGSSIAIWPHPDAVVPGVDVAGAAHYTISSSAAGGFETKMHSMEFLLRAVKGQASLPDDVMDLGGSAEWTFTALYPVDILIAFQGISA